MTLNFLMWQGCYIEKQKIMIKECFFFLSPFWHVGVLVYLKPFSNKLMHSACIVMYSTFFVLSIYNP